MIKIFNWTQDDSELIDFDNGSFDIKMINIQEKSCKIYRIEDEIKTETINTNNSLNKLNLNEYDENMKLGEIKFKNNKYYFIPNIKDNMNEFTGNELFSWLIYKGNKYPETNNKYKLKEGDILKLGRVWLIVRVIHIPKKNIEIKNTNCLISFHSQINESINVNNDFKEDKDNYNNLIDDDDESSNLTEEEDLERDNNNSKDNNKTEILNNSSQNIIEEEKKNNLKPKINKKKNKDNQQVIKKNLELYGINQTNAFAKRT